MSVYLLWLRFLDEVQSHSAENKMSAQNLATVFGPNILRPKLEDPVSMMEGEYKGLVHKWRLMMLVSHKGFPHI